jgi:hypothetical protein
MQRAEPEEEQIWSYIEARKQKNPQADGGRRSGHSNGAACSVDALLVNMLCSTFEEDLAAASIDRTTPRSRLMAEIRASAAPTPKRFEAARRFWRVNNRLQMAAAIALCLITIAALAYLGWYFRPLGSECNTTSPAVKPAPAVAPSPKAPGKPGKSTPKIGAGAALPVIGAKAPIPVPDTCK